MPTGPVAISQLPGSTPTSYFVRLLAEGDYTLTVQVTGPDGLPYSDSVNITALPKNRLSWQLKQKWENMKSQVIAGNIQGALTAFTQANRDSFQAIFNDPSIGITSRLNEISSVEIYTIKNDTAQGGASHSSFSLLRRHHQPDSICGPFKCIAALQHVSRLCQVVEINFAY